MPPIQPSGSQFNSYTVTNEDLINSVPISFTGSILSSSMLSDGSFDGVVKIQFQLEDGSWEDMKNIAASSVQKISDNYIDTTKTVPYYKFPFVVRFIVTTPATAGTCILKVTYI